MGESEIDIKEAFLDFFFFLLGFYVEFSSGVVFGALRLAYLT